MGAIVRAARKLGIEVERPRSGSHWKFKREGDRTYPIPAHNGEKQEIDDKYIQGLCRNFNLSFAEFKQKL
jgi:hypothetical protein